MVRIEARGLATYFDQPVGNTAQGEREIDAQSWSSTVYTSKTMKDNETILGFNFIDGRLKGYPLYDPFSGKKAKINYIFAWCAATRSMGKINLLITRTEQ